MDTDSIVPALSWPVMFGDARQARVDTADKQACGAVIIVHSLQVALTDTHVRNPKLHEQLSPTETEDQPSLPRSVRAAWPSWDTRQLSIRVRVGSNFSCVHVIEVRALNTTRYKQCAWRRWCHALPDTLNTGSSTENLGGWAQNVSTAQTLRVCKDVGHFGQHRRMHASADTGFTRRAGEVQVRSRNTLGTPR